MLITILRQCLILTKLKKADKCNIQNLSSQSTMLTLRYNLTHKSNRLLPELHAKVYSIFLITQRIAVFIHVCALLLIDYQIRNLENGLYYITLREFGPILHT